MFDLSLLLVDDNVLNQKLIKIYLSRHGFKIDVAIHGQEALERIYLNNYDAILMDLMMPVMDGYEATIKIREYQKDKGFYSRIVGLTANAYDEDRHKCLSIGMDEFMVKPFEFELFKSILENFGFVYKM